MILRQLTRDDETAFLDALRSFPPTPSFNFAPSYFEGASYSHYLSLLEANQHGQRLPAGHVSSSLYFGFAGKKIVGRLSIRHELNDFLLRIGGHIGYGVLPSERRMGYATEMLRQSLPIAKAMNLTRILLTCDDDNAGSAKTIENCGGVLESTVENPGSAPKRRYWIDLTTV